MGIKVQFNGSTSKIDVGLKAQKTSSNVDSSGAVFLKGEDGATFIPEISEEGILSWTNDKSLENPKPINIKGPVGAQGEKGETGPQGPQGPQGIQGEKGEIGKDGYTPIKGIDYFDGQPGKDGYTPIKGTDYFTESDKQEIAKKAAELVEAPGGGVDFETDNTLTLSNGILSVNTTNDIEKDNTLPITSAGVYATVGNIEALLKTI